MKIRLFDPAGIKPEDYKHRYPELERTDEFNTMQARALIFVWWYANPTSDLVLDIPDDYERVAEALRRSQFNPGRAEKENILHLQFNTELAAAIKKMASFDPGSRFKAYMMVRTIFKHYDEIAHKGPEAFKVIEGKGDNVTEYIDYARYVTTNTKIAEELPELLHKLEEGFGVTSTGGNLMEEEDSSSLMRDFHMGREN
jgi:hypothetical protein